MEPLEMRFHLHLRRVGILMFIATIAMLSVGGLQGEGKATQHFVSERDTDGDGLSDYQEIHKYLTDPRKSDTAGKGIPDGDLQQRKEFTYTITSVMKILKPARLADMNDDYQDARLLAEDADSYTVEITYYPFNTNADAIGENPNWKQEDATLTEYLQPTPTENWDAAMRKELLAQLREEGIDPDRLTDRALVEKVSVWAMRRSRFANSFASWYVDFPNGKPTVPPGLRTAFEAEKPNKIWTDQQLFEQEVLGKAMFAKRVHGSCTSSSVYLATILRALGIPTRIVFCIPPADPNDKRQMEQLFTHIHHHQVHLTLDRALTDMHGWDNHLFNEVYIAHRWVRLNYNKLGQNILDPHYFGLLTHIYTCRSLSEAGLARTWGPRYAHYDSDPMIKPRLSSVNPYQLLSVTDHFGMYSNIPNPEIVVPELRTVTISGLHLKGDAAVPEGAKSMAGPTDFFICIAEWLDGQDYHQLRKFYSQAGHNFVLKAPGYPDVKGILNGSNFNGAIAEDNGKLHQAQGYLAHLSSEEWKKVVPGVKYTLQPENTNPTYRWIVSKEATLIPIPSK